MKKSSRAFVALVLLTIMSVVSSCSHDVDAFWHFNNKEKTDSKIRLNLDVASTRADTETGTDLESKITSVCVYVFNDAGQLEKSMPLTAISEKSITLDVASGLKTVYVVSQNSLNTWADGTKIEDFEKTVFSTTLSSTKNPSSFVMIGKSDSQYVMKTAADAALPASNIFTISMVRLLAKGQVLFGSEVSGATFGFSFGDPQFRACQTNNQMKIVADGDVVDSYTDSNGDGTYDSYYIGNVSDFTSVKTGAFDGASGCAYMTENLVSAPVSGNTTFISIKVPLKPAQYYNYSAGTTAPVAKNNTETGYNTFYAVGIVDAINGVIDYCIDSSTKQVYAFQNSAVAGFYCDALNGGAATAMTVSDTETPLLAPSTRAGEDAVKRFEVVEFTNGASYYRVNVGATDSKGTGAKVERNKFYKITINSIKNIGCHNESLLIPTNAESSLNTTLSSRLQANFEVADWDVETQSADL